MSFRFFLLSALIVLTSCAYMAEEQIQDITIETPGAENATCYMYVEGLRYKVTPPQTINISKSSQDLIVDCLAPGNRRKKQVIAPTLSKYIYGDVAAGGLPAVWDYASASLYKYPDIITVDFTNTPIKPEAMPAQNRPDVKQPEEYPLEEKLPGRMRMNSDKFEAPMELRRRERSAPMAPVEAAGPYMVEVETTTTSGGKGDLKKVAPASAAAPVQPAGPAYPGQ